MITSGPVIRNTKITEPRRIFFSLLLLTLILRNFNHPPILDIINRLPDRLPIITAVHYPGFNAGKKYIQI